MVGRELITLDKLLVAIETASEFDGFMAVLIAVDCTLARLLYFLLYGAPLKLR